MKYLNLFLLLILFNNLAFSNEILKGLDEAEQKINNGEIQEGKVLLDKLSNNENLSNEDTAIIYNKIAWFHDEFVGNYEYAKRFSRNVLELPLPKTHPAISEANKRISKIQNFEKKYRNEFMTLRRMQFGPTNERDAKIKIKKLESFIENNPNFPALEMAYHYLGKNYLFLNKYYKSKKIFSRVLEKKPGIIFLYPTKSLLETAENKWDYFFLYTSTLCIIIISLLVLLVLLYFSKFWEWFNLKSLTMLPITIVAWGFFLFLSSWILDNFIPDQKHLYLSQPQFIEGAPFSPGSQILITIFNYGIMGIIFSFLLTVATQQIMKYKTSLAVNSIIIILFFSAIFGVFYQKKCYQRSIFEKRGNSNFPDITGHFYFQELDYEPIILTNPRKYPDLTLDNTNDKIFVKWILKQYAIINNKPLQSEQKQDSIKSFMKKYENRKKPLSPPPGGLGGRKGNNF